MAEENGWVVFAQVAGPIVALALGVVGVWNEKIKNWLFGPKLELEADEPLNMNRFCLPSPSR
ncbi:MAG: hypothetical protein KJ720_13730 [Proteobacteria bacterium]|nr:hypothetical protein [Pseudomonadota bacterium]MBU1450498.1 hypothetical protein [Pseudomonadota bacterium]MBU2469589.1 hypothetical protein [Pseudomonadota bacterium]MBU2516660.1 hypothetical protein [Pseudomonadota bacterium]